MFRALSAAAVDRPLTGKLQVCNLAIGNRGLTNDIAGNTIKPVNAATKLLEAMRNNPRDWRIEQLQTVARQFGMVVRSDGGSHHVFSHEAVPDIVSVPAHRPIKPVYVRQFVMLVNKVKESQA